LSLGVVVKNKGARGKKKKKENAEKKGKEGGKVASFVFFLFQQSLSVTSVLRNKTKS
jgi:hypothetical protein